MDLQDAAATLDQDLEIAPRLSSPERGKGIHLAGDCQMGAPSASDLKKTAAVRSALEELTGGMKVARSEAETGRYSAALPNESA